MIPALLDAGHRVTLLRIPKRTGTSWLKMSGAGLPLSTAVLHWYTAKAPGLHRIVLCPASIGMVHGFIVRLRELPPAQNSTAGIDGNGAFF